MTLNYDESGVVRDIAPNDGMFDPQWGLDGYFYVGKSTIKYLGRLLERLGRSATDMSTILDLPCGFGRELRYLKAAFPSSQITACDLLTDAVDYCAKTFGAIPVYSRVDPEEIPLRPESFDLIWVGSLFTHLDEHMWPRFLVVLQRLLRPGGLLAFTTHGRDAYDRMVKQSFDYGLSGWRQSVVIYNYQRFGFAYVKYPGIDTSYGCTFSEPEWVVAQLARLSDIKLVDVSEKCWVEFQDVFAVMRMRDNPERVENPLEIRSTWPMAKP